jgi:hypothetical protein
MDPSQENKTVPPAASVKTNRVPAILITLLLVASTGIGSYFYLGPTSNPTTVESGQDAVPDLAITETTAPLEDNDADSTENSLQSSIPVSVSPSESPDLEQTASPTLEGAAVPPITPQLSPEPASLVKSPPSPCEPPEARIRSFFNTLDEEPYMAQYNLPTGSEEHFTALIHTLLDNPPQVTRESDDLYTILKNTAHFFRISGKDNVFMMKGILGNEKDHIEQILADYYLLISTPECSQSSQIVNMDQGALYEYACFFLNTMGGRLYLFRRDSLSRMVVTYYAILLVDKANREQSNKHGLDLHTFVKMLIAEMETGGSSLKYSERYLDSLYLMQEKYQ